MPASDLAHTGKKFHAEDGSVNRASENLLVVCWRQWRAERALRHRGIHFRTTNAEQARAAYAAMSSGEFAAINGRQAWANRRTILRSLDGLLPDRPILALDLGSGIGSSTAVLADASPEGSTIIAIEFAEPLVEIARGHLDTYASGRRQIISFTVGSVTETYRDANGRAIDDEGIDLVNASGIFGHHLDPPDAEQAVAEITRVLKPKGIAALDVGPRLPASSLQIIMETNGYTKLRRTRSNLFDRTGQLVFQKR